MLVICNYQFLHYGLFANFQKRGGGWKWDILLVGNDEDLLFTSDK